MNAIPGLRQLVTALDGLAANASPGPYHVCGCGRCAQIDDQQTIIAAALGACDEDYSCGEGVDERQRLVNAHWIASLVTAWPVLRAALRGPLGESEPPTKDHLLAAVRQTNTLNEQVEKEDAGGQ